MPGHLTLLTEDLPSEVLGHRLLAHADPDASFVLSIGRKGLGYIQSRLRSLNEAAKGMKIVAIVDRDSQENCPVEMIAAWLGGARHPNLSVRFAEMEIESWIMSDREGVSAFLDVPLTRIPESPDHLADPKQTLVNIARLSRSRKVREEMCRAEGARIAVGPAYNSALEAFIRSSWRANRAMQHSPSLRRAEQRIRELAQRII
jgi:hypothetical protein